jgi:hypothetical protein
MTDLEQVPDGEAERINHIVELTRKQLDRRYANNPPFLRGVHPKDHGCVKATFTVLDCLVEEYRVGVFSTPGRQFDAWIRFSNADVNPKNPDSSLKGSVVVHGSRGMAVKLMDVNGSRLMPDDGELTQDFLMINQPVFAFANVEDYEALSEVLLAKEDKAEGFFGRLQSSDAAVKQRAGRTADIIKRITSASLMPKPGAFQSPPRSPLDNEYFGAAPFLFGEGRVMRFKAKPVSPESGDLTEEMINNASYLRAALHKRLTAGSGQDIEFEFQVQVRSEESLAGKIDTHIEDVCFDWDEEEHPSKRDTEEYPFVTVAKIAIPPQDCSTPERKELCESLVFSPWHGLVEHRPLGGINRLRRAVYQESAQKRARAQAQGAAE